MTPIPLRVVVVVVLAFCYWVADDLADLSEELDAIGSKRSSPVEAADWKRLLYRGVFALLTLVAAVWTVLGVVEL